MYETTAALAAAIPAGTPAHRKVSMWTTAATAALVPVALLLGGLAPMASHVSPRTVDVIVACWWASWTATPLLAAASRVSVRRPALATAYRWAGRIAPVPPAVAILLALSL
ncbi:hypothetical protein ACIGD1_35785 [Streptomyces sp. NPDC085612]|uniref:hypothetical protein n=1 Tax=Streptomyces sp. NPDC085612 TaxID=3365732 RepID=UPI0037D7B14B